MIVMAVAAAPVAFAVWYAVLSGSGKLSTAASFYATPALMPV